MAKAGGEPRAKEPMESTRAASGTVPASSQTRSPNVKDKEGEDRKASMASKPELQQAVESINDFLQANRRALEFSLDDQTGRMVITVMDAERQEVIRQIPPEQALKLIAQMRDANEIRGTGLTERA